MESYAAIWHYTFVEQSSRDTVYIRAPLVAYNCGSQWEPWTNIHIPPEQFFQFFQMGLSDLFWLVKEIRYVLAKNPVGCSQPLSVEVQVGLGLYRLAHGSSYVTIGHVFNIKEEDKASGQFVNAIIKEFRFCAVKSVINFFFFSPLIYLCHPSFPSLNNQEDWRKIKESFQRRKGITCMAGAIDGTNIPIIIPASDNWKFYINRKNWASIVFQCVVNGDGNFWNVEWSQLISYSVFIGLNIYLAC